MVSCGSGWKTAGYFMMKLPHLFMKTQRNSDETPDVARLCGFPAAGTAHPQETRIELRNHPSSSPISISRRTRSEGDDVLVLRTAEVDLPRDAAALAIVRGRSHRQLFSFMQNDLLYIMPHPAPQRDRTTIAMIMRGNRLVFGNGQHLARGRARSPGQRPYIWPEAVRPTPNRVIQGARANQGIKAATRAITHPSPSDSCGPT